MGFLPIPQALDLSMDLIMSRITLLLMCRRSRALSQTQALLLPAQLSMGRGFVTCPKLPQQQILVLQWLRAARHPGGRRAVTWKRLQRGSC